jgi:uncharacterized protein YraI
MKHAQTLCALATALAAVAVVPATAQAQQTAYVSKAVNLRAGPSSDYPVVAILGAGVNITVEGCMSDYRWCDVSVGTNRGWLYAGNIVYPYQGTNVPLLTFGSAIGIGVIAFSVGSYWDDYYRYRPWYPQRQRWIDRPYSAYPAYPVPYPVPNPVFRPGFQHPPPGLPPVPRPPHGSRPGFDQRPPHGVRPIQGPGQPPGIQAPPGMPRPHQGMRRGEGHRPGEAQGHRGGRHP